MMTDYGVSFVEWVVVPSIIAPIAVECWVVLGSVEWCRVSLCRMCRGVASVGVGG